MSMTCTDPSSLAGNKQLVAAKRHVRRLAANLDGGLLAERRIDQTHRVTLQAGEANEAVVRAVAGDLRRLRDALEPHSADDAFACRVDQEQRRLLVINGDDSAAIGRDGNAGERARGL
jgi:hypothetical protein